MARSSKNRRRYGRTDWWQIGLAVAAIVLGFVLILIWKTAPIEVTTTAGQTAAGENKQAVKASLVDDMVMANAVISTEQQTSIIIVRQADGTLRLTPPSGVCVTAGVIAHAGRQLAFVVPPERRFCGEQVRVTVLDPQTRQPLSVRDGPLTIAVAVSQ